MVPKELLAHCRGARTRYEQHQADSEKKRHIAESSRKRKHVMEEIKEQKLKKVKIEKNIESLEKEADFLSLEAEKKESFLTLSKANALRAKAKSVRAEQLAVVDKLLRFGERVKVTGGLVFFIVVISQKYNHKQS